MDDAGYLSKRPIADNADHCLKLLGLRQNPFSMAPDIVNFYSPPRVEAIIVEVLQHVETRMGFALLYGDVGLGKTTLSRRILLELDRRGIQTALVFNTFFQGAELLREINRDFGVATGDEGLPGQMAALNSFLLQQRAKGRNCVIIIDDAQNLTVESLELVRQISNMETGIDKIVQIILIGQSELEEKLDLHSLRQLKSRIALKRAFRPYTHRETATYIRTKIARSGERFLLEITDSAIRRVHVASGGSPRRINVIMGRCLYAAIAKKSLRITRSVAEAAVRDVDESFRPARRGGTGRRMIAAAVVLVLIAAPLLAFRATRGEMPAEHWWRQSIHWIVGTRWVSGIAGVMRTAVEHAGRPEPQSTAVTAETTVAVESGKASGVKPIRLASADGSWNAATAAGTAARDGADVVTGSQHDGALPVHRDAVDGKPRQSPGTSRAQGAQGAGARVIAASLDAEADGTASSGMDPDAGSVVDSGDAAGLQGAVTEPARTKEDPAPPATGTASAGGETDDTPESQPAAQAAAGGLQASQEGADVGSAQRAGTGAVSGAAYADEQVQGGASNAVAATGPVAGNDSGSDAMEVADANTGQSSATPTAQGAESPEQSGTSVAAGNGQTDSAVLDPSGADPAGSIPPAPGAETGKPPVALPHGHELVADAAGPAEDALYSVEAPTPEVEPAVVGFLRAYGLTQFSERFQDALDSGRRLKALAHDIFEKTGLRLVELPAAVADVKTRYATLRVPDDDSQSKKEYLLFWKPHQWAPESFSEFFRTQDVVKLQKSLAHFGAYRSNIDGIAGPHTTAALKLFQRGAGLTVTGVPDVATLFMLEFLNRPQSAGLAQSDPDPRLD